jgi:hypothetical protein
VNATRHDPLCPVCSTSVRVGTLRSYEEGVFYHVSCRNRQRDREVLDSVKPAPGWDARDTEPVSTKAENSTDVSRCPVCEQPATLVNGGGWFRVEGCPCGRFSVTADVLEWRLPRLTSAGRAELAVTIQGFRAMGRDAWLSTASRDISGRIVVRGGRLSDGS